MQNKKRLLLLNISLLSIAIFSFSLWLGYRSVLPSSISSRITMGKRPLTAPDRTFQIDLWAERPEFIVDKEALALVTEKNPREIDHVRFLCPRRPNEWSELKLRFPLDSHQDIDQAFLKLTLLAASVYDSAATLKLSVVSEATKGKVIELAELSARTGEDQIPEEFEITEYLRSSSYLEIRINCIAGKLLYHPTPDDPIGYAACQALRQPRKEPTSAILELWYASSQSVNPAR